MALEIFAEEEWAYLVVRIGKTRIGWYAGGFGRFSMWRVR